MIGFDQKLSWEKDKGDYVLKCFKTWEESSPDNTFDVISAYTKDGEYIGGEKIAKLLSKRGIAPELADESHNVCSIGFCKKEQKWYGWSHRAIYGFGVGDVVKEGDSHAEYLDIGFKAKTLDDARAMAVAFAASVS